MRLFCFDKFLIFHQAFEMMFKSLDANVEIDFAHVCTTEAPLSIVIFKTFEPNDLKSL
jgi:hypothetical protein